MEKCVSDCENSLSFVIPVYNEEESISDTINRLKGIQSELDINSEIIIVNDGSTDRSEQIAFQHENISVLSHPSNIGYGNAIKSGVLRAKYDWICIVDADGSYPLEDIHLLVAEMKKGYDMVVGARTNLNENDSYLKRFFRSIFKWTVSFLNDNRIEDPNSGFRIFKRSMVLKLTPFLCGTFSFTTSLSILTSGLFYFIKYVPIQYHKRNGRSKVRHIRDTIQTIQYIIQGVIFFNPLKFFVILSALMVILVCIPAMAIAYYDMPILSLYYMIFGTAVTLMIGMGGLGDIIRISSHKRTNDFL
jgi:glycosyltransferase involved in cell wall biosynthesis